MRFERLRFKNFLSYGDSWTEINLCTNKVTLLTGRNGHGKSTILSALYFALSGKPYTGVKKNELINTRNKKNCVVELYFSKGNTKYKIIRGIKPNVFEVYKDDVLVNEDSHSKDYQLVLEEIINIAPNVLKNTIMMSSRFYSPFLAMTLSQKREFIENILSITVFSQINDTLKKKISSMKQQILETSKDIERVESNVQLIKSQQEQQKQDNDEKCEQLRQQIKETELIITQFNQETDVLTSQYKQNQEKLELLKEKLLKKDKINAKLNKLLGQIESIQTEIDFYTQYSECYQCGQEISASLKTDKIDERQQRVNELQVEVNKTNTLVNKVQTIQDKYSELVSLNYEINNEVMIVNKNISVKQSEISMYERQIQELRTVGTDQSNLLQDLDKQQKEFEKKLKTLEKTLDYMKQIVTMLSEKGIKRFILNKYIPVLNKLLNEYLEMLDSPYQVVFDEELNDKIIAKGYDNLSYKSFSAGEMQRVDISLLFAFLELSRLKNSVQTNLLILDEILDASLDENGIQGVFKIFKSLKAKGYTIFVISHRPGIDNNFDEVYNITKKVFSEVTKQ